MSNTRNDRVIDLLKTLGISEMELSRRTGKQPTNIYRITRKESEPTPSTLMVIATACGASYDWLLTGHGDMFQAEPTGEVEILKDVVYKRMQDQIETLKEEVKKAWAVAAHFSGGKLNFHKASWKQASGYYQKQPEATRATA